MTRFVDGPANGQTMMLRRAPLFLRVTQLPSGKCDALDALEDKPMKDEAIFIYRREGEPTWMAIRPGGVYRGGNYRLLAEQPTDEEVRTNERWAKWVTERVAKENRSKENEK